MRTQAQTKSDAHPSWSFFDSCHPDLNTTFTESACFILKWIFVTRSVLFCLTPASSEGEDVIIGIKKYLRNQHLVLKRSFLLKKKMLSLFRNVWSVTALPSFFHETVVGVRWSLQNRFEKHKNYYLVHILYIRYTRKTSEQQFFSLYLSVFFKRAWVC